MQHSEKKTLPRNKLSMPPSVQFALESCRVRWADSRSGSDGFLYLPRVLHLHSASVNAISSGELAVFSRLS